MASYRLNREALEDLDRLYEHGVLTFGLRQADAYFDGIVNRFQKIADQPVYVPLETRGYLPLFRSRTKITPP